MLTGDNQRVAERIAAAARVDEVFAELLPRTRWLPYAAFATLTAPVAMVGDGVSDVRPWPRPPSAWLWAQRAPTWPWDRRCPVDGRRSETSPRHPAEPGQCAGR